MLLWPVGRRVLSVASFLLEMAWRKVVHKVPLREWVLFSSSERRVLVGNFPGLELGG